VTDRQLPSDEELEVQEFLIAARELEGARVLEEAEFIREREPEEGDAEEIVTGETQEAPAALMEDRAARRSYWQAQGLVELEQGEFAAALEEDNAAHQRSAYYRLAVYHGRTIYILRSALGSGKEPLAQAAMRNLATLHRAMVQMHRQAPHNVPVALVLDRQGRTEFARDLVVRALQDSAGPLDPDGIVQRANDLDVMGVAKTTVRRHLKDLEASGHVEVVGQHPSLYARTQRTYTGMDLNAPGLRALVGPDLYLGFDEAGFAGLSDVLARQTSFRERFCQVTGLGQTSAALFVDLVETLLEGRAVEASPWTFTDLIGSPYPRPYQYEACAVFRGYGYHGQLVEAPTGSGKTMIGMMCLQDWLQDLRPGQSILILVPTSNYLQQWTGELCYKPIGLRLSPEMVFAGTPNQLERFQKRTGSHPAVLLMTYTALAQAGSAVGKGGFDVDSIEMFLQGANVRYVILDEVHKVAENLKSVSADVIRLMLEWLHDGSLEGLVGFTGTAEAYRSRFARLGLQLVYSIPIDELVAAGFVAPFAELGAPFSYSERERRIRDLLDLYKARTLDFMEMVGGGRLRAWFAGIPMEERVAMGHELLNMYQGRKDWASALPKRLAGWESGGSLQLTETKLVTLVQIARRWSDGDLVRESGADPEALADLVAGLHEIRAQLAELIYLPSTLKRLQMPGFTTRFDVDGLRQAYAAAGNQAERNEAVKDGLSTTIVGLYEGLSEWYRRVGEGRVETIKAVIEAERATRPVTGIIIFDNARRIDWKQEPAMPGYEGLGGLYAQLLGDERFTPYAVLSSEQYLPYDEEDPLPPRISAFVEDELMRGELATAMFDLAAQGLALPADTHDRLRQRWDALIDRYIPGLRNVRAARPGDFSRRVLRPMRRHIRAMALGFAGERLLSRMDLRNIHFADLVSTFFDYAIIARYFRQPRLAELEQVSGARQRFFVIPMSSGNRKLLMYDLTSRIVDAESLPINMVVVSSWARTGWNVISPNVLIDATATRDVTAWQQLRGRAIRARRTWTNDCYRLILALIGSQMRGLVDQEGEGEPMPEDVVEALRVEQVEQQAEVVLDDRLRTLLAEVTPAGLQERIETLGLSGLTGEERTQIAVNLMRHYNKVTHIFELVKAYGSTTQVEYNRPERVWQRRANIAAKHEYEVAVNPFSGEKLTGDGHAPLVYAQDPRADLPAELQQHLVQAIEGSDDRIVAGWLQYGLPEPDLGSR
jgi:superfamily II DNA or RNA helicase